MGWMPYRSLTVAIVAGCAPAKITKRTQGPSDQATSLRNWSEMAVRRKRLVIRAGTPLDEDAVGSFTIRSSECEGGVSVAFFDPRYLAR